MIREQTLQDVSEPSIPQFSLLVNDNFTMQYNCVFIWLHAVVFYDTDIAPANWIIMHYKLNHMIGSVLSLSYKKWMRLMRTDICICIVVAVGYILPYHIIANVIVSDIEGEMDITSDIQC